MKKVKMPESWLNVGKERWKVLHQDYRGERSCIPSYTNPRKVRGLLRYPFEVRNACGDAGGTVDRLALIQWCHERFEGDLEPEEWLRHRYRRLV